MPPIGLKNELITSTEFGVDLRFFNNRLGLDVTLYQSSAKNQILSAVISPTSGYNAQLINAGQIDNQGIEVMFNATPVQTSDFRWNIMVNWSKNTNEVVELNGEIETLELYKTEGGQITVIAPVGGSYGDMMGKGYVYDDNGDAVVGSDGIPLIGEITKLGNIMPDWLAGVNNTFSFRGFNFGFLVDAKVGGDIYSRTEQDGWATGVLTSTVGNNPKGNPVRDPVADGGGYLFDGVFEDGTPNDVYLNLDAVRWNQAFFTIAERWLRDATYVKLREVSLSYSLPYGILRTINLSGIELGLYARNVAILYSNTEHFDPEVSNRDASGYSQGSVYASPPSARNIGFRAKLTF